jgi:hypothetical protein
MVARAMAKKPDARYPSGEDMAADIDSVIACRPLAPADDLPVLQLEESPLASMLQEIPASRSQVGTAVSAPRPGPMSTLAEPIPLPPRWDSEHGGASWARRHALWIAGGAAAVLLVLGLGAMRPAARGPEPRRVGDEPPPRPVERARTPEATPTPEPPAPREPEPVADGEGKLEVDFEHHLRSGRIQVWVDEDEVLDEQFDSRVTKKILSLRLRKGAVQQVLPIPAGRHEVLVRLQWSDKVRTRRIAANFEAGRTRTLRVRVSRIFNDLSLSWQ